MPETPTTAALAKNTADLIEAEEYVTKLKTDRLALVTLARTEGVTWWGVESLTGVSRQGLTAALDR